LEIVNNYDVDGIVFDDYFYPGKDFSDGAAYSQYGGSMSLDNWRRNNVTTLIYELYDKIHKAKPAVKFGVSPFGIWASKANNSLGSDTAKTATQSYYNHYADTRKWVKDNRLDFICPQIYWPIGYGIADYTKVFDWWSGVVKGTGVSLYVGNSVSRVASPPSGQDGWKEPDQLIKQLRYAAKSSVYSGSAFYSYKQLRNNPQNIIGQLGSYYAK